MMNSVRTRFAPSPTGLLHVGGLRTALFAWLVARHANGEFVLRLEDTDKSREVEGTDKHIMESLRWLGVVWDEGPDASGPYGPYRQSERLDIYKEWAAKLVKAGRAYADPYTPAELDKLRQQAKEARQPFLYRNHRPGKPPSWTGTQPLRFKSEPKRYHWHDTVMGKLSSGPDAIDDFIIMKSDGYPTYNFAHIVDDHLMRISHVIRSQEFVASIPKYLNLYEALSIEAPVLATVPYVMGSDGTKKLSKRDGAKDILDYEREGYLPEALVNFMSLLGWNDGSEQEIFSIEELIAKFRLERVQKSGARFDEKRLIWMNGMHIRQLPLDELYDKTKKFWQPEVEHFDEGYRKQVLGLVQERLKYFSELPELTGFFFVEPPASLKLIKTNKQLWNIPLKDLRGLLEIAMHSLEESDFSVSDLAARLNALLAIAHSTPPVLFSLIRIATTQVPSSPGLAETMAVLGKERSLKRIEAQIEQM